MAMLDDEDEPDVPGGTTARQARAPKEAKNKDKDKDKDKAEAQLALSGMGGPQKAAIILMAVGEQRAGTLFTKMDDDEIKEISSAMATLGSVGAPVVEELFREFVNAFSGGGSLVGSYEGTERLLSKFLDSERLGNVMEDIRGPAGRTMWEKLANVNEQTLATYLKNEYPQTIAVVISKITPDHAARVLGELPEELSTEVVTRILTAEPVKKEILTKIEETLRHEFMANLAISTKRDSHEIMAEIFNNFDRSTEDRFMSALEGRNRESADKVKSLMFTFEDLVRLDPNGVQVLLRTVDKGELASALKGATDSLRDLFLSNMSERAGKILSEDMEQMGPIRQRDVSEAQGKIVNLTKELADKGELMIADENGTDELVY
jgi:flagellar motor switch protein FliG